MSAATAKPRNFAVSKSCVARTSPFATIFSSSLIISGDLSLISSKDSLACSK